jgi:hypothetical protein
MVRSYSPHAGYDGGVTWQSTEELLAWLAGLPPAEAIAKARLLADTKTAGALRAFADELVFSWTREATYGDAATELGLSLKQVEKAVERRYRASKA